MLTSVAESHVESFASETGVPIFLKKNLAKKQVTIALTFRDAGLLDQNQLGMAQLMQTLFFTKRYETEFGGAEYNIVRIRNQLHSLGMQDFLSFEANNCTYQISFDPEDTDKIANYVKLLFQYPWFKPETIVKAYMVHITNMLTQRNDIGSFVADVFKDSPLGLFEKVSHLIDLKITPTGLTNFFKQHLTADKLTVLATGRVLSQQVKSIVEKVVSVIPRTVDNKVITSKPFIGQPKYLFERPISKIVFAAALPKVAPEEFWKLRLLGCVLTNNRLFQKLRGEMGAIYAVQGQLSSVFAENTALWGITATYKESADSVRQAIQEELLHLAQAGVTDEEMQAAREAFFKTWLEGPNDNIIAQMQDCALSKLTAEEINAIEKIVTQYSLGDFNFFIQNLLKDIEKKVRFFTEEQTTAED